MKHGQILFHAVAIASVIAFPATADYPLNDDESLKAYGDVRLRLERDDDSEKADGSFRRDRDRFRTRLRLGLKYQASDNLSFNIRARTGNHDAQQSPHITLWQDHGSAGEQGDVTLDKAYAKLTMSQSWIKLGRDGLPFWKPNEFLWDDDVYIDGLMTGCNWDYPNASMAFNGAFAALPDGDDRHARSNRSTVTALQFVYQRPVSDGNLTIADGFLYINDNNDNANGINQAEGEDLDYRINAVNIQYKLKTRGLPLAVGADYMHNFADGAKGDAGNKDRNDGWDVYAKLGSLKEPGDFLAGYYYARVEKYAVARHLSQDDWFRWGSATQTRSSDYKGHEIRVAYAFTKKINLVARGYLVDAISTGEDGKRFRLDLNVKL
ncbi:MAG: putative porin [Lentisphaeria bacterium]|jgi:hypothetical protein|nr:putative porin [Lentisphaeria bacterium]